MKLNQKHKMFCEYYCRYWNGTRAYLAVYPDVTESSARARASLLLTKNSVKDEINRIITERAMTPEESMDILAEQAKGDIADILEITPGGLYTIDMAKAKESGKSKLIKKIRMKTITKLGKNSSDDDIEINDFEVELYSAQAANRAILEAYGKIAQTGKLEIIVTYADKTPPA